MSLRDDLLPVVDAGRQLADDLGLRRRVVKTRLRVWPSGVQGRGSPTDTDTTLSPTPKVREPPARFVHDAPGRYEDGDLLITKISATYTDEELTGGTLAAGSEWFILVSSADDPEDLAMYRVVGVPTTKNFAKELQVRRISARRA